MYRIKNDRRSVQSGEMIYGALRELMAEKQFESITVTEVVNRAGVGRATFYRNFDTMDDVLQLKCDQRFEALTMLMLTETERENPLEGEAHRTFLHFWYQDSEIIELLVNADRMQFLLHAFQQMFERLTQRHMRRHRVPDRFVPYLYAMQSGMAIAMLMRWIKSGKDIPPDELADLMEQSARLAERISIRPKVQPE